VAVALSMANDGAVIVTTRGRRPTFVRLRSGLELDEQQLWGRPCTNVRRAWHARDRLVAVWLKQGYARQT